MCSPWTEVLNSEQAAKTVEAWKKLSCASLGAVFFIEFSNTSQFISKEIFFLSLESSIFSVPHTFVAF